MVHIVVVFPYIVFVFTEDPLKNAFDLRHEETLRPSTWEGGTETSRLRWCFRLREES